MNSIPFSHAHSAACESSKAARQSTRNLAAQGSERSRHCVASVSAAINPQPRMHFLVQFLILLLLFAPLAHSAFWSDVANTDWYTSNTSASKFTISTPEELAGLAQLVNGGTDNFSGDTILLANDISLNDTATWKKWENTAPANFWTPIGIEASGRRFNGTFDGAGFVISGLYINGSENHQGLFGYDSGAVIKNVGVVAGYVKGGSYIGFLVGYNNCGTVINSYATGNVSGSSYAGGVVGYNYQGLISNSYATGTSSSGYVGGVVGLNHYYGITSNSYYNGETNSQSDKGKGTPKSTAEMQSQGFVNALNTAAGIGSYNEWQFNEGNYPTLKQTKAPPPSISAYFASGNGSETLPYIITTKEQLENLALLTNAGHNFSDEHIKLANSIVLNDTNLQNGWQSWDSTTSGLTKWLPIGTQFTPFSGTFDGAGHKISGLYIGANNYNQGLFGYINSETLIENVGVIAGYVRGNENAGFLAGYNYRGAISNSYAGGNVSALYRAGGLAGENSGTISNSYATGNVSSTSVNTSHYIGGFVGYNSGTISNSYSVGAVGRVNRDTTQTGGFAGVNNGIIINSYYDATTSGWRSNGRDNGKGIQKSTGTMQSQSFADLLNLGSAGLGTKAWVYYDGNYPTLTDELAQLAEISTYFESGSGTSGDPYTIKTKQQLENLALITKAGHNFSGEHIKLAVSIMLNNSSVNGGWASWSTKSDSLIQWVPIGVCANGKRFAGTFDGAGLVISGLYINTSSDNQGLFGCDSTGAVIKNVGVTAGYVKGGNNTGFLIGYNNGGTISNSYATGNVSGSNSVGGLAGYNSGTVSNNYATGKVSGSSNLGGLAGYNSGTVSNSYYDKTTSGQSDEDKGIPKTTAEMKSQRLVDILNIVSAGLGSNGWVYSSGSYPKLSSELAQLAEISTYFESGSGTSGDPYIIKTKEQLENLALITNGVKSFSTGKYFALGDNIALNNTDDWESWDSETTGLNRWIPIGTSSNGFNGFRGNFNGNGYKISGLYISTDSDNQGLFGYDSAATIKNVGVEFGYVKGGNNTGFLVGYNNNGTISNNYASDGKVSGSSYVGGLAGYNSGTISNNYASGSVSGTGSNIGGLAGYNATIGKIIINSYYDTQTSGQSDEGKGIPKTTEEMKSQDFTNLLNLGSAGLGTNAWAYKDNYPTLTNELAQLTEYPSIAAYFAKGDGSESSPYIIETKEQLNNLALLTKAGHNFLGKHIKLANSIALNDTSANGGWQKWGVTNDGLIQWMPIGSNENGKRFVGTFDGAGFVISGLYINTSGTYQGLFGVDSVGAVIKNVGVIAGYVKGGSYVGFLAGSNGGTISNSYATGAARGTASSSYVGGLAGVNSGTISNSYATGAVTGTTSYVGGLVGHNNGGIISNSYSAGLVSASGSYKGGLVGWNDNGTIISSYYNKDISAQTDNNGKGVPKSTEEMKYQDTFDDWDFDDIWGIGSSINSGMPYFRWEYLIFLTDISAIPAQEYSTEKICPEPSVKFNEANLVLGVDFEYSCEDFENINVGTGYVTVIGKGTVIENSTAIGNGHIKGKKTVEFNITKIDTSFKNLTIDTTYSPTLTLGDIAPANYVLDAPNETPLTAGNNQRFSAIYTSPSGNYNTTGKGDIIVNVAKAQVAIPTEISLTYSGQEQIGVNSGEYYSITGNTGIAASKYTATAVLDDTDNYEWADGTIGNKEISWAIAKYKVAIPTATETQFTYSGTEKMAIAGGDLYSAADNAKTDAGNYTAILSLKDTSNYEWADGTITNKEISWAIARADGEGSVSIADWVYGEAASVPSTSSETNTATPAFTYSGTANGGDIYSGSSAPTEAGDYTITAVFPENGNYNEFARTADFTIIRANGTCSVTMENWISEDIPKTPNVESSNGTIPTFSFADNMGKSLAERPTAAGDYAITAIFPQAPNYEECVATNTFTVLPKAVKVTVNWSPSCGTAFTYDGNAHSPVPTAEGFALTSSAPQTSANTYTATAELANHEQNVILENTACPYSIEKKPLTVSWSEETVFTYNKMVQAPKPSVSESGVNLLLTNAQSEAGVYKNETAAYAEIEDQAQAGNYILQNRTKSYTILQAPLDVIFEDKGISEIEGIIPSANGTDPDTLYVDAALVADSAALKDTLSRMLGYRGFKTDTTTKQSDDKSVLSGTPQISFPSWDYPWSPSSPQILAKRVSTSVKATAVVSAESVSAKNYEVNDKEILVLAREEGDEYDAPVSPMGYCKVASAGCAYVSSFICAAFKGEAVETCDATPIAGNPIPYTQTPIPIYFNLQGQPLGSVKPKTPGIYIEKTILGARKIAVR